MAPLRRKRNGSIAAKIHTYASRLNNAGQLLGAYGDDNTPFLYDNGVMYDLNSLVDPAANLTIRYGYAINDHGEIAAKGCDASNKCFNVLLSVSPVPEPAHWAMLLAGLAGLAVVARRRSA